MANPRPPNPKRELSNAQTSHRGETLEFAAGEVEFRSAGPAGAANSTPGAPESDARRSRAEQAGRSSEEASEQRGRQAGSRSSSPPYLLGPPVRRGHLHGDDLLRRRLLLLAGRRHGGGGCALSLALAEPRPRSRCHAHALSPLAAWCSTVCVCGWAGGGRGQTTGAWGFLHFHYIYL